MRKRLECYLHSNPLRQCLICHEGNFPFVISLDVVAFHFAGYVIHRIYRQSEIRAFCWLHLGSHYYSYRNARQTALTVENDTQTGERDVFSSCGNAATIIARLDAA